MKPGSLARFVDAHGRAILLVALSLALAGLVFTFRLPVSLFPQTDFPRIVILVDNGIAPVDIQMATVTRRIEEAVRLVPGVTDIRSVTARGSTEISVFFRWDVNIVDALELVQGQIAQIAPTLPPECRFYINRLTFSVFPMLGFSLTSERRPLTELWELAYYELVPRLYRIPGVMEVRIVGGRQPEFHVLVDPGKLVRAGLPLNQVVEAIRNANLVAEAGMIQENYHLYLTTVTGLVRAREQLEEIVVAVKNGTPIRVRDIATVQRGERPVYNIVTADGKPAVLVNVLQQPDGNALAIAEAVHQELQRIRQSLPSDIHMATFYDQSVLVRDSILSVRDAIVLGLLLSIAILLGFLKDWRTTAVAAMVIPTSMFIAVVFMQLFHMSFNLMTLGGLAACVGIVIDDAIVMVENIVVHVASGQELAQAALSAVTELTPALIGSTLTPIVVFVPLVFLGGLTTVFFRALALTMVTALLASLALAIFVTPLLARLFLRSGNIARAETRQAAEQVREGRLLRALAARYRTALGWSLDHPGLVLAAAIGIALVSAGVYSQLGSSFLPEMDEGAFVLDYIMPPGTSLEETNRVLLHIEEILRSTPEVESYSRRTGARLALAIAEPNTGDFLVKLKPFPRRPLSEVVDEIRNRILASEPAIQVEFPHILEDLIGDLAWAPQPVEIKVFHPDPDVALDVASRIEQWLPTVRGVVDIANKNVVIGPAVNFRVDPQRAGLAGFSARDVAEIEAAILDGVRASETIIQNRIYGIRVRYPEPYRSQVAQLRQLQLVSPHTGVIVPLSSLATVQVEEGQREIHRYNLKEAVVITAQLSGRDLGSVMQEIQRRLPREIPIPAGTDIEYGGLYQMQRESFRTLTQVLVASILLIFIILVFEFRSFAHPVAILLATLLCTSGALLALLITGQTLNISSFMGMIMVVGIVHKNGILMLDAEQFFSRQGLSLHDAIYQAGQRRLRPILMTALATVLGMLPLALGIGAGVQLLRPLAIAVIGGVTVSMLLSLLVTPVLYYLLRRWQRIV